MSEQARMFESRVERKFNEWIQTEDGQRVLDEALRRVYLLKARGLKHYGMAAIFEAVRYDWHVGLLGDGEYRLNNNHRAWLTRWIERQYPDLDGFFEKRETRGRL